MLQEAKFNTLSQYALTTEQAFRYGEQDSLLKKTGKFTAGTTVTTLSFVSSVLEFTLSFFTSILTSPLYLISPNRYSKITHHTADSARTAYEAARRTLGRKPTQIETKDPSPIKIDPSRVEQFKEFARAKLTGALQFSKDHQKAIIATSIAMLVVGAILGDLHGHLYRLVATAPEAAKTATSPAYDLSQEGICRWEDKPLSMGTASETARTLVQHGTSPVNSWLQKKEICKIEDTPLMGGKASSSSKKRVGPKSFTILTVFFAGLSTLLGQHIHSGGRIQTG